MKNQHLFLILFLCTIACKSPTELLDEGNYQSAFSKAVSEVKKQKNVEENLEVIKTAAKIKAEEAMLYSSVYSNTEKVDDWVKTQTKLYKLLKEMGQANIVVKGLISEDYDQVCNEKKDLDFQIVEHYYDEGHDHLDRYHVEGNKIDARHAYKSFKNCEKYEGASFFPLLIEDIEEAHQKGTVYYTSNYGNIGGKLFLKYLPKDADFEADCKVHIDYGYVSFSTSEDVSTETHTKEIQTGTESETDTSGVTTEIPIYEEISAEITTKTITAIAEVTTYINVKNITGQCNLKSYSFSTEVSDSYEEISVDGDERALNHHVNECSGEPSFFRSKLEDRVIDQAEENIGY